VGYTGFVVDGLADGVWVLLRCVLYSTQVGIGLRQREEVVTPVLVCLVANCMGCTAWVAPGCLWSLLSPSGDF
jgi:hypothetical protein